MRRIQTQEVQPFEKEHKEKIRALAPECMVLLKSDGTFPIGVPASAALYGSGARKTIKGGTGSGDVNVRHFTTVEEGLENAGFVLTTKEWMDAYDQVMADAHREFIAGIKAKAKELGIPSIVLGMGAVMPEPEYELSVDAPGEVCIYVLGRISGEGSDRNPVPGDVKLTHTEIRDILELNERFDKFLLVLNVGGVVDLSPVSEVKNILLMSQLGLSAGDALADVILGKSYPSGKLTATWAPVEAYPSTKGFADPHDTLYHEGIYVGYRYFDTVGEQVTYPFGYGLGYTVFQVKAGEFQADEEKITVSVTVKNTGSAPGKEVVQIYYSAPEKKLGKPWQELAAWAKTRELAPGECQELVLEFSTEDMASYDMETACYVLEEGTYYFRVGTSSRDTHICGALVLDQDAAVQKLSNVGGPCSLADEKPAGSPFTYPGEEQEKEEARVIHLQAEKIPCREAGYENPDVTESGTADGSQENAEAGKWCSKDIVRGLTPEELASLCIGAYREKDGSANVIGSAAHKVAGAAGETTRALDHKHVSALVMADGPAGLRLSPKYQLMKDSAIPADAPVPAGFEEFLEDLPQGMADSSAPVTMVDENAPMYYQYCTAIPIGTALAQSWNEALCRECAHIVGEEMEVFGVHLWLAPALNIHRSPLCGRSFEYYSEDPAVSGRMAAAITEGIQRHPGCGATIKHYAANNQETNRYFSNSVMNERALREIYLKGFEICVKEAMPHALMTSYNLINGEHSCSRQDLITQVLRREWGFQGIVMTDWLVTGGMGPGDGFHVCASAAGCIKAGNDLIMPGGPADKEDILAGLRDSGHTYPLTRQELEQCALRVLNMVKKLTTASCHGDFQGQEDRKEQENG